MPPPCKAHSPQLESSPHSATECSQKKREREREKSGGSERMKKWNWEDCHNCQPSNTNGALGFLKGEAENHILRKETTSCWRENGTCTSGKSLRSSFRGLLKRRVSGNVMFPTPPQQKTTSAHKEPLPGLPEAPKHKPGRGSALTCPVGHYTALTWLWWELQEQAGMNPCSTLHRARPREGRNSTQM